MTEQISNGGKLQRRINTVTLTILTSAVVWGVKTLDTLNTNYAVSESQRKEERAKIEHIQETLNNQSLDVIDLKGKMIRVETVLSDKLVMGHQ